MSRRAKPTLAELGRVPRMVTRATAIAYVGVSPERFDEMIEQGRLPAPVRFDPLILRWDRFNLEERFNRPLTADLLVHEPDPYEGKSCVYFIGFGQYVKIGRAKYPVSNRLRYLQTGCPEELTVHGWVVGDKRLERKLHKRFKSLRVRGEWFRLEGALADYIAGLPA